MFVVVMATHAVLAQAQRQFGTLNVDSLTNPYPGYYLFAPNSADSLGLMDHSGRVVIRFPVGPHANPRSDVQGLITHFSVLRGSAGLSYAYLVRDQDGVAIDTVYPIGQMTADFHEGRIWSDSSYLILSQRWVPYDLSKLRPNGNPDALIVEAVIQEISKDGRLIFQWRSLEHIPPSATMEDMDFSLDVVDYIHVNSVERDNDGNLLVSCRHIDAVLKVDRLTGKVLWALGGTASKVNEFTFIDDSTNDFRGFSHQHSAFRTSKGTLMLFDNGNLKPPPQATRVVEYELDEVQRVAKRVWEYRPEPAIFSISMGNVVELPSGRLLIGYGSRITDETSPGRVLEEVDRQGNVYSRMSFLTAPRITPYRVSKVQFGMTGLRRDVEALGLIGPVVGDSTTNLSVEITSVSVPTAIVIEKHYYPPHASGIEAPASCAVAPYRWVVRSENPGGLSGTIKIRSKGLTFADPGDSWQVYWRPKEGSGQMTLVEGTAYDRDDSCWSLPRLVNGEYTLVTSSCVQPNPIAPADGIVIESVRPSLVYSSAARASAYEVQIAKTVDFAKPLFTGLGVDTQLVVPVDVPQGVLLFWRVRRMIEGRPGLWSKAAEFSILPTSPVLVWPVSQEDTVGAATDAVLRWQPFVRASSYRVVVSEARDGRVVTDRTVEDTTLQLPSGLTPSRPYTWSVQALTDTGTTVATRAYFGTLPAIPWMLKPEPSVFLDRNRPVDVHFRPVTETDSSEAFASLARGGAIGSWPISGRRLQITDLPAEQDILLGVQVRGRYGWSQSAVRKIRLVQAVVLDKLDFIQPLDGDFQPVGSMATFEWQPVDGATSYHIQATDWVAFDRLTLDTVVTSTIVTKKLAAGAPFLQWRVQARSEKGIGPWSDTVYVNLRPNDSVPLLPLLPRFGQRTVQSDGSLVVRNRTGNPSVRIEVGTDPYLDDGALVLDCTDSIASYTGLTGGTRHYWRPFTNGPDSTRVAGASSVFVTEGVTSVSKWLRPEADRVRYDRDTRSIVFSGNVHSERSVDVSTTDGRLVLRSVIGPGRLHVELPASIAVPSVLLVRIYGAVQGESAFYVVTAW